MHHDQYDSLMTKLLVPFTTTGCGSLEVKFQYVEIYRLTSGLMQDTIDIPAYLALALRESMKEKPPAMKNSTAH